MNIITAASVNHPPWFPSATLSNMNLALGASFYPRLADSLALQLYSQFPNAANVAAATAYFSGLHAAAAQANSAANNQLNMPPPLSPYHPANTEQHPGSTGAHHTLLSQYFYSPAAYGGGNRPTPFGSAPGRPPHLPVNSAFLPTGLALPRYRYILPTPQSNDPNAVAAAAAVAAARIRNSFTAASQNSSLERTISETSESMANRFLNRTLYSPLLPSTSNSSNLSGPSSTVNDNATAFYHQQSLINASSSNLNDLSRLSSMNIISSGGQHQQTSADIRCNPLTSASLPTQPYYPSHFMKGTVIQLANGDLKRVEDLNTEDFVRSAHLPNDLKIDCSAVVKIDEKSAEIVLLSFAVGELKVHVSVEATVEHPFFVIGQGWSSCNPERTQNLYGLPCQRLQVGDICISLTHRDVGGGKQPPQHQTSSTSKSSSSSTNLTSSDGNSSSTNSSGIGRTQMNAKVGVDVPFSNSSRSNINTQTNVSGGRTTVAANAKRSATSTTNESGIVKRQKLNASSSKLVATSSSSTATATSNSSSSNVINTRSTDVFCLPMFTTTKTHQNDGFGRSSVNRKLKSTVYSLPCQRLQVGDSCISLTHRSGNDGKQPPQTLSTSKSSSSSANLVSTDGNSSLTNSSGIGRIQMNAKVGVDVPFSNPSRSNINTQMNVSGSRTTASANAKRNATSTRNENSVVKRKRLQVSALRLVVPSSASTSMSNLSSSNVINRKSTSSSSVCSSRSTTRSRSLSPCRNWTRIKTNYRRRQRRMSLL